MAKKTIEDIPGVGPAIAARLRAAGYTELMVIAVASPKDLSDECEVGERKAMDIIEGAKLCVDIGGFETNDPILERKRGVKKLKTGSIAFDELMNGGLETQSIVEIFGKKRSCKTQMCLQLAVNAMLPEYDGGLDSDVVFIDTQGNFVPEKMMQMATGVGLNPQAALKRIHVGKALNSNHQTLLVEEATELLKKHSIRLIIIDSFTSHFKEEYIGRGMLAEKQQRMYRLMYELLDLAMNNNILVIITNIPATDPRNGSHCNYVMGHSATFRIYLSQCTAGRGTVRLIDSPNLPDGETTIRISDDGIGD
jgi:RecA/RadA recombinase